MTRIPFDQLAKQYLQDFLEPLGTVRRQLEVPGESKFVDLWFSPSASADDTRRNRVLQLLMNWRTTLDLSDLAIEEQDLMSTLSQAYLAWEQETEQRGRQQGLQQGMQQGAQQEARSLVLRLLTRKLGPLPEMLHAHIITLALPDLEALGEALLEFSTLADLEAWLQRGADNQP